MITSWRVNKLGKAPIGTLVEENNKLYIKEQGDTPHKGEWYRPWKCVKIDGKLIDNGGYVSSAELGFSKGKILGKAKYTNAEEYVMTELLKGG